MRLGRRSRSNTPCSWSGTPSSSHVWLYRAVSLSPLSFSRYDIGEGSEAEPWNAPGPYADTVNNVYDTPEEHVPDEDGGKVY